MSRCGFNTFLAVGLLQISIRILEITDKISTHLMPSTSRVRPLVPGSREAPVQGPSPGWIYVIAALLVLLIIGDFNLIQTPFPGHLSKVWPMSRDPWCGTVNSRSEQARGVPCREQDLLLSFAAERGPDTAPLPRTDVLGLPADLITRLGSSTCSAHKWLAFNTTLSQVLFEVQ